MSENVEENVKTIIPTFSKAKINSSRGNNNSHRTQIPSLKGKQAKTDTTQKQYLGKNTTK